MEIEHLELKNKIITFFAFTIISCMDNAFFGNRRKDKRKEIRLKITHEEYHLKLVKKEICRHKPYCICTSRKI